MPQEVQLFHAGTRYDRDAARAAREKAASGLTGSFADQAAANPYGNAEFTPNWYQKLAENLFGDYSARDAFYQQQDQSAMEYVNQLLDAQRQQQYNSPAHQAAMERAAGINPDVVGLEGNEPAAAASPDDTPPEGMGNQDQIGPGLISTGVQAILTSITGAFDISGSMEKALGLISMMTDVKGKSIQNTAAQINMLGESQDKVLNLLANLWPTYDEGDVPEGYKAGDMKKLQASEIQALVSGIGLDSRSKNFVKSLMGMLTYDKNGNVTTGLQQRVQELRTKRLEDAQKEVGIMSSPGFNEDVQKWSAKYYEMIGEMQNNMMQVLIQAQTAEGRYHSDYYSYEGLGEGQAAAESAQNAYDADYYNNLDPEASAQYEMAQRKLDGLEAQLDSIVSETFTSMITSINDSDASEGSKIFMRQMVYQMRASYNNQKLARQAQKIARGTAKGRRLMSDQVKDLVDVGTSVLPGKK